MVPVAGGQPGENARHSMGIGGAKHLLQRLATIGGRSGRWSVWTQAQATKVKRQVVSVSGVQPEEYALYSLRFGGATHLSAEGALLLRC